MKKFIIAAAIIFSTGALSTVNAQAFSNKKDVGTADNKKDVGTADAKNKKDVGTADNKKDVGTAD
ncbi:hypothetical protein IDJ75_14245 [Mucilaginibacter rigui]|uniref:Pentapeptide MXKDX repeat protein n=1 Tax=Mucilaginibacter rigui TaxID=534635 RepID=A0ABR7X791_9SPHI|nr:hypothetical protein [Mucilaginibacter rigui]MBD1386442.1 hypothetical protein [Mucilaginibacter rigui]